MMNHKLLLTGLVGLAALVSPVSVADTVAGTPDASVHSSSGLVGEALASLHLLNEVMPHKSARYYIYICSAGWCGPCNKEMPHLVEAYAQMKRSGLVEMLLVDYDYTEREAREFQGKYGVLFPAIMSSSASVLPGFLSPRSIPFAIVVDADGNVIKSGNGAIIRDWKRLITDYETEKGLRLSFPESRR